MCNKFCRDSLLSWEAVTEKGPTGEGSYTSGVSQNWAEGPLFFKNVSL